VTGPLDSDKLAHALGGQCRNLDRSGYSAAMPEPGALEDAMVKGGDIGRVWVFDARSLEAALVRYQQEAVTAYPHQQERVAIAVAAIRDFLYSRHADTLTMNTGD
jgi:hypothetical protein